MTDSRDHYLDLKAFGAIGFQDAPNGLWLGKQGYGPQRGLIDRFFQTCLQKGVTILGLTSEDDKMDKASPEDRFGFLRKQRSHFQGVYSFEPGNPILMKLSRGQQEVCLVNSETLHAPKGEEWYGLKLHVVGSNLLEKERSIFDAAKSAKDKGLVVLLSGVDQKNQRAAEGLLYHSDGVITHDASNRFGPLLSKAPPLANYSRARNEFAQKFAADHTIPGIAVSSAHWFHEIGRAGIALKKSLIRTDTGEHLLADLHARLKEGAFTQVQGYNDLVDTVRTGYLLKVYGSKPNRFAGTASSYN